MLRFLVAPHDSARYWTSTVFDSNRLGGNAVAGNQSLRGMVLRAFEPAGAPAVAWPDPGRPGRGRRRVRRGQGLLAAPRRGLVRHRDHRAAGRGAIPCCLDPPLLLGSPRDRRDPRRGPQLVASDGGAGDFRAVRQHAASNLGTVRPERLRSTCRCCQPGWPKTRSASPRWCLSASCTSWPGPPDGLRAPLAGRAVPPARPRSQVSSPRISRPAQQPWPPNSRSPQLACRIGPVNASAACRIDTRPGRSRPPGG